MLFFTRFVRLFSYGMLAVVLVFYRSGIGLSESAAVAIAPVNAYQSQ